MHRRVAAGRTASTGRQHLRQRLRAHPPAPRSRFMTLQPIWDWMLSHLGVGFFEFPLYFLPVVVAVVLVTGVVYWVFDVAVYRRISAKAAARLGARIMSTYIGAAVALFVLHRIFRPWV